LLTTHSHSQLFIKMKTVQFRIQDLIEEVFNTMSLNNPVAAAIDDMEKTHNYQLEEFLYDLKLIANDEEEIERDQQYHTKYLSMMEEILEELLDLINDVCADSDELFTETQIIVKEFCREVETF
jgi:predicted small metal-binding protein